MAVRPTGLIRLVVAAAMLVTGGGAQEQLKRLDPASARTSYSFPLRPGSDPFRFQVQLDSTSTITGVQVFRRGESGAFQTLPACTADGLVMELDEYDNERELLKHQDLDFDGFEDVQLLQYYVPHLGKSIYCIYTWSPREGRFRYAPDIPEIDPVANPQNKTISVHEEWFGGVFIDRTYRWSGAKPELVVENGTVYGSDKAGCGFTEYCSRLINGKMVKTASRPFVCTDGPETQLVCPSSLPPRVPATRPSRK